MSRDIKSHAKTTETSLSLIDALQATEHATIEELSQQLGLSPSTVHRHLVTLRNHDLVTKDGEAYRLALGFLTIGGHVQRGFPTFEMIKTKVDELAATTGERAQFIVEEHGERVYLYTDVGESDVQTGAHIGTRGPIHVSAAGKAILAHMDEANVREIIDERGLDRITQASISTEEDLFDELETIRERGYAFNRQETTKGVHAIGAAVTDPDDGVLGALSVSGPANRIRGGRFTEELPRLVLGAVNELELHIEHSTVP